MARLEIPDFLNYACRGCGLCCRRGFNIWCPSADHDRYAQIDWASKHPRLEGGRLFVRTERDYRFAMDDEGACRFLDGDLCIMHREIGYDAKTITCKMYPILLNHSGRSVHVSLLFSCPAVIDGEGPPLSQQKHLIQKLLTEQDKHFPPGPSVDETALDKLRPVRLDHLRLLEARLDAALADESLPFVRRLLHAASLLDRLETSTEDQTQPGLFPETLAFVDEKAREDGHFGGLPKPKLKMAERILLRQLMGLCSGMSVTGLTAETFTRRWGARLDWLRLAARYLWGGGPIPHESADVTFQQVWPISAHRLPPESETLLARYMRSRFAGRQYFGKEGWGLPVLSGARFTLILPALVLWHAKAEAAIHGRTEVSHADIKTAVMMVDHAFGHTASPFKNTASRALGVVNRPGWPQKAFLYLSLPQEGRR